MQTKVIKGKIKSIGNIKKITKTMEMVSVAKMRKASHQSLSYTPFELESRRLLDILGDQRESHPLSTKNINANKKLIIIIGGEKGLCGSYNSNIYRHIYKKYKNKNEDLDFIAIGKYGEKIAKKFLNLRENNVKLSFVSKVFSSPESGAIVKYIVNNYLNYEYREIVLVFTDFLSISKLNVVEMQLLPFSHENVNNKIDDLEYVFEPNLESVYSVVVGLLLRNIIEGSVTKARASEHASRMLAMKTATDNAGEMQKELKLWYNKARQAHITQEIAEISAGSLNM